MYFSKNSVLFICSLFVAFWSTACVFPGEFSLSASRDADSDATRLVREQLQSRLSVAEPTEMKKISLEKERYDFYPDYANEKYLFVSNNDEGLKRIAFLWNGLENVEFDGNGSTLVFHGYLCPFVLEGCKNVAFKNFSIDWHRTFHSEGEILAVEDEHFDVRFAEDYPYKIDNGLLIFTDFPRPKDKNEHAIGTAFGSDGKATYPFGGLLEFDAKKRETAFLAWDYWIGEPGTLPAKELGDRKVRIFRKGVKGTVGNIMVFGPNHRKIPLFTLADCENIRFENVNMYHSGGMGIVGLRSRDIEVKRCKVTPPPGKNRIVSLTADATHFVNCNGKILLEDCVFENQKDDATNVHGIYAQIVDMGTPDSSKCATAWIDVRLIHAQQYGFDFVKKDMKLDFVDGPSMNTVHSATVLDAERLNKEITRVFLDSARLPENVKLGDAVCDADIAPELTIRNCYIGKNRARGVLLNSRGKTLVEGNTFHTPGAAILLEGDARFWFEQAGVRDLTIRNNVFDNCNFGVWGWSVIETRPGIAEDRRAESRYNKNVLIENNTFKIFDNRILNFYSTDGLIFRNNKIETSTDYPTQHREAKRFAVEHCDNVNIKE